MCYFVDDVDDGKKRREEFEKIENKFSFTFVFLWA